MQEVDFIFSIAILILSVVVHEVSHGFMANILGDGTARHAGRLTLNPLKHLDPVGSFFIPLLTYFAGGFIFGWAKPVPYNPHNLRDQRWGDAKVAAAGPFSNLLLAVVFGLILRFGGGLLDYSAAAQILQLIIYLNLILAVFNLVPIPPLDGSKILFSILPYHLKYIQDFLERYWLVFIGIFIFFVGGVLSPVVDYLFRVIVGG
ncbi:MAG: site-2 protease family protein [Parcubacteria group bacterium]|nr:site-2 protease family protein [Parcubacteria group bacterium]